MSQRNTGTSGKGSGKGHSTSTASNKHQKRDFELVSPASPDSPVTMAGIRELLQEELQPIVTEMDNLKKALENTSTKLDEIEGLGKKVKDLESRNLTLTHTIQKQELIINNLEERVINSEAFSRRYNLRFCHIKPSPQANVREICEDLIINICQRQRINLS